MESFIPSALIVVQTAAGDVRPFSIELSARDAEALLAAVSSCPGLMPGEAVSRLAAAISQMEGATVKPSEVRAIAPPEELYPPTPPQEPIDMTPPDPLADVPESPAAQPIETPAP